jgi:diguanylate cyclase (GGDEF)-like protein
MVADQNPVQPIAREWQPAEIAFALALFLTAAVVLAVALVNLDPGAAPLDLGAVTFFLIFGLLTITIGYEHPNIGYYSFDRISQVASILVLGPVDAAWVNGLASFIYPWHRLWKGVPFGQVLLAAIYNSSLMALLVFVCGALYQILGGEIPLQTIGGWVPLLLAGLVLAMQTLNDLGMLTLLLIGRRDTKDFFQLFSVLLELGSGAAAVLVALVYNAMSLSVLVLLLTVLGLGMFALKQFANMRLKLERLVAERTRRLEEKTRELALQATEDNLTGLYNRRYVDTYLNEQFEHIKRYRQKFSIALADIDFFKQINDQHSHATGDEVLKRVAAVLLARCRKTDMIARYGGEEFLICFPGTDPEQANALCETLRAAIEHYDWGALKLRAPVTISFGIAECRHDQSLRSCLDKADLRLYEAKNSGRNRVVA